MCFKVRVDVSISLHSLRRIEFKTCCHKQRYKYCTRLMLPYQIRGFRCNTFLPVAFVGLIAESSVFLSSLCCCCREVRYTRVQQVATPTFCFWVGGFLSSSVLPVVACSVTTREQGAIFAASILRFEKLLPPVRIFRRLRFISDGSVDQRSACVCVCVCMFVYVLVSCRPSPFLLFAFRTMSARTTRFVAFSIRGLCLAMTSIEPVLICLLDPTGTLPAAFSSTVVSQLFGRGF